MVYEKPGVAETLLKLQNEVALDVNMMLWCVWCGERFGILPEAVLHKGWEAIRELATDVTAPLRQARRRLKEIASHDNDAAHTLRAAIKQAELNSEQLCQNALASVSAQLVPSDGSRNASRRNLAAYARLAGAARKPEFSVSLLESLIEAIYGAVEDIDGALGNS